MRLFLFVFLAIDGFAEAFPAVNKGLKWRRKGESVKTDSDTRIVFQNWSKRLLEKRRLYDNRLDGQLLAAVIALDVANQQRETSRLLILGRGVQIIRVRSDPWSTTITVWLAFIQILNLGNHAWFGLGDTTVIGRVVNDLIRSTGPSGSLRCTGHIVDVVKKVIALFV